MRKLLLLSLLSIFSFTSCDIDVDIHYDNIPYSVWAGSTTNNITGETIEYTIAFDDESRFSIVKVLYDKLGLAGTMTEMASNYEIRKNEAIVNIGGRVERFRLHDDYITASLYDVGVGEVVDFTFRKVNSIGVSNSQWVYENKWYNENGDKIREVIILRFKNGGQFEERSEIYIGGRLDNVNTTAGNYSTYGNNVILHERYGNTVLVNIKDELLQVEEDTFGKIYIVNFIRK